MMETDALRSVLDYHDPNVLSVYLDVNPAEPANQGSRRAYQIWLADQLKNLADAVVNGEKRAWRDNAARLQTFVDTFRPNSKGVVIFSGSDLWQVFETPAAPRNRIWWGQPLTVPLRRYLARRHRYGLVIIDQEKARFFAGDPYDLEELPEAELTNAFSEEPSRETPSFRGGGGVVVSGDRDDDLQGRVQALQRRFMDSVVQQMAQLATEYGIQRWTIAGQTENRAILRDEMPLALRDAIIGETTLPSTAGKGEIQEKILPAWQLFEMQERTVLVDKLLQQAETNFQVVLGMEKTLEAIQEGRSSLVLIDYDLEGKAWVCPQCGWVALSAQKCPVCGIEMRLVHLATAIERRARDMGSEVEIIDGEPAKKLKAHGEIGAFLRF